MNERGLQYITFFVAFYPWNIHRAHLRWSEKRCILLCLLNISSLTLAQGVHLAVVVGGSCYCLQISMISKIACLLALNTWVFAHEGIYSSTVFVFVFICTNLDQAYCGFCHAVVLNGCSSCFVVRMLLITSMVDCKVVCC